MREEMMAWILALTTVNGFRCYGKRAVFMAYWQSSIYENMR
jgi:hypothetical protein